MRIAIAQARTSLLDTERSLATATDWIVRAARDGVELLAFGESFLGGYPVWVDWPEWAQFDHEPSQKLYARLRAASIELDSPEIDALRATCADSEIAVVIGAHERAHTGKSIYNALLTIGRDGKLERVRRKLVPTHGERLCWAPAPDARRAELDVARVGEATVGGLICWEHWMPAARQRLHETGENIHVAAWPHVSELHHLASRHYAFEGSTFVLATASVLDRTDFPDLGIDVPDDFGGLAGGSAIIGPDSRYLVEPVDGREELLVADIDLTHADERAFYLDTAGHYHRPDIFAELDEPSE